MQETKITMGRIRNHFAYSWWKYVLFAVVAVVGWNLIYTATAYKPPRDKRLDAYFVTNSVPDESLRWFEEQVLERYPEVEDTHFSSIVYTTDDNYYGTMQLTTYLGAGEGDAIILPRERFLAFAQSGTFVALDDAIADGRIDLRGIDPARGYAVTEDGERAIYGIPADSLYGLMDLQIDNRDLYICVLAYTQSEDRLIDWVDWMIETMQAPKPDWLVEYEERTGASEIEVVDMPSY